MDNWIIILGLVVFSLSYLLFVYKFFEDKHKHDK
jgi:hypothetical protein